MSKTFYDDICPECNRMKWDHSPICPEWIPPWERKERVIETEWELRDRLQQVQNELRGWREKHAKVLLEIDRLTAKVDRTTNRYKYK